MTSISTKEIWDTYLQTFDHGKTGSKTFRVDLFDKAPISPLNHLLIVGTKYQTKEKDGFPQGKDFELLYNIGDQLIELVCSNTNAILVGSFLYNNERLEYFYLENPKSLISKIEDFYSIQYPNRKFFINIKEDASWMYYKEFLYPKENGLIQKTVMTETAS